MAEHVHDSHAGHGHIAPISMYLGVFAILKVALTGAF